MKDDYELLIDGGTDQGDPPTPPNNPNDPGDGNGDD